MDSNVEYKAFSLLYDTIQTGIQSGIDDVVGKAFSKGLISPHVKSVAGNATSTMSPGNRTAHLLDAILARTKIYPNTYDDFASVLDQITAFQFIVEMMQDRKREVQKQKEEMEQERKEVDIYILNQKIRDLHLPNLVKADRGQLSSVGETSQSDVSLTSPTTQVYRGYHDDPLSSLQSRHGIESPLPGFHQLGTPVLSPYSTNLLSKSIVMDSNLTSAITVTPGLKMGYISKDTDWILQDTQTDKRVRTGDSDKYVVSTDVSVTEKCQRVDHQPDVMASNPTSQVHDLCSLPDLAYSPTQASFPSDASSNLLMPTDTVSEGQQDEATPTIRMTLPTPSTPPSVSCSSSETKSEHLQFCPSFSNPCRERSSSISSLLSTQSSINSLEFFSAHSSLVSSEEDADCPFVQAAGSQIQEGESGHHAREQSLPRIPSSERLVELKAQHVKVTKELAALKVQTYTQQVAHSKQERQLLNELQSEKKEKFELQNDLKNVGAQYRHSLTCIAILETHLLEVNKRFVDLQRELKDVKADAYNKWRELDFLKEQIRRYEAELEILRRCTVDCIPR